MQSLLSIDHRLIIRERESTITECEQCYNSNRYILRHGQGCWEQKYQKE